MSVLERAGVRVSAAAVLTATALTGGLALDTAASAPTARAFAATDDPRPNIVLITTDDQTLAELAWMPRTRNLLGDKGVELTNSLSPHPFCCPARAEILTGQYAQNNGVRTNQGPMGGFDKLDSTRTIATWLDDAGYQTAFVGKFLNGYTESDGLQPGWDIFNPTVRNVYRYYDYTMFNNGSPVQYTDVHNADLVGDKTAEYITQFAEEGPPFFIWASQVAPHGACDPTRENACWQRPVPAERHARLFKTAEPPSVLDASFNEEDMSDKPGAIRNLPLKDPAKIGSIFRNRIRSLQAVDQAVARTVTALRTAGVLENTLIVFTSDNGYLLGEHRIEGKDVPYEQAVRVPLLVRGPGAPAGVRRTQTVSTIDLAPSFLDATGASANLAVDGRSFLPLLGQEDDAADENVLLQSGPRNKQQLPHGWNYRGVRTDRYTYVRYPSAGFVELYDRVLDPAQMQSVAHDPRYAEVEAELARRTEVLGSCTGESCHQTFDPLPEPTDPPAE